MCAPREKRIFCSGAASSIVIAFVSRERCLASARSRIRCEMRPPAPPAGASVSCMNMVLSIMRTSTSVRHTTSVLRVTRPSSSPVSPKKSPGPSRAISPVLVPVRTEHSPDVTM